MARETLCRFSGSICPEVLQNLGTPTPEPVPKPFRAVPSSSANSGNRSDKSGTKEVETVPEHDEVVFETDVVPEMACLRNRNPMLNSPPGQCHQKDSCFKSRTCEY